MNWAWAMLWQEMDSKKKPPAEIAKDGLHYFVKKYGYKPDGLHVSLNTVVEDIGISVYNLKTVPSGHYFFVVENESNVESKDI